jgi:D-3-phosphoglycerate dehydrogenase
MKIIILDDYQDAARRLSCFAKLTEHDVSVFNDTVRQEEVLVERLANAEALVLIRERTRITGSLLERLPRLRLISQTAKAGAHIDLDACTRYGVAVAAGYGSPHSTVELTWGLILAAMRHIPLESRRLREGCWQTTLGTGLRGRTLGVFGYGNIGRQVAQIGRAFGMSILVHGREGSLARAADDGLEGEPSRQAFFARCDVITLHLRLVPATRGIVGADDLACMKRTALFVNASRAELVEPGALLAALQAGHPGYAAVDVYEEEPVLNGDHPLLGLDNVVCTPHLGYVERDTYELYFGIAFDNINAFAAGSPANIVNPEVLNTAES